MSPKPALTPRLTLKRRITQQEWRQFSDRCAGYKTVALQPNSYTPTQTANELWFCCCKELHNDLQNVGITPTSTEGEILDKVKDLSVKAVNLLLNLCKYFKMSQKEGENVRQYVACLKGAADLCNFTVGSGTEAVSYVDQMVLGRLVAGLRDKQITREILEEAAKLASYD